MEKKKKNFLSQLKEKFFKKKAPPSREEYEDDEEYEEYEEYEGEGKGEAEGSQSDENEDKEEVEVETDSSGPQEEPMDLPPAAPPIQPKIPRPQAPKLDIKKFLEKFSLNQIIMNFFSPTSRKTHHKIFQIFLTISICYTIGKTGALILKKAFPSKIKRSRPTALNKFKTKKVNLTSISKKNLFNTLEKKRPKFVEKKTVKSTIKKITHCREAKVKSSLPVKLINTIVLQNSKKSLAILKIPGKRKFQELREGDEIKDSGKIGKIQRLRVVFLNLKKNRCEFIENKDKKFEKKFKKKKIQVLSKTEGKKALKKKKKGISSVGNNFKIKKSIRDNALKNIQNVLTQARAVQIKNPDGSLSFKMTDVVPGSIYSQLNISDGDIISGINGKKIENLNEILNLFGKIKDIDNLSLTILKDGQKQENDYEFH
jgi:type II secretory pathway component PulC